MKSQVWKHTLKNHSKIKDYLLKEFEKTPKNKFDDGIDLIERTDYYQKSDLQSRPYFAKFHLYAKDFYDEMVNHYCLNEFNIRNGWFQQYKKKGTHHWHFHGGSNLSFVYYIELDDKRNSTEFYDLENRKIFQLDIKEGDIAVFPSYIPHRSPVIETDNRKTIISCNVNFMAVEEKMIV
tara:strand:+ start:4560 stop:5096 length:537 start_codon:yes stop_codon:yes gene_type:complete